MEVPVLYVARRDAKTVKTWLESQGGVLDKRFRMQPASTTENASTIAIPIVDDLPGHIDCMNDKILGKGRELCRYSSSVLGNHRMMLHETGSSSLTSIQQALLEACLEVTQDHIHHREQLERVTMTLSPEFCPPRSLEILGDHTTTTTTTYNGRVLVLPPTAFALEKDEEWEQLLVSLSGTTTAPNNNIQQRLRILEQRLWPKLAKMFDCGRIARKGAISAASPIRQSGHCLLWPTNYNNDDDDDDDVPITGKYSSNTYGSNAVYILGGWHYLMCYSLLSYVALPGPGSPGWVTVTEHGIKQSFDFTRVMFSRGNVTEKIRFGKMVQEAETVLDLYAGIGYFSLPALIHGKCASLVACEWNEDALMALRYNLEQNNVHHRAQVYAGDCR